MTEAEFKRRLAKLLDIKAGVTGMGDLSDFFGGVWDTVKDVGSAVADFATSDTAKALVAGGASVYVAGQQLKNQQAAAQISAANLNAQLLARGYAPNSPGAQQLITDVAQTGVVGANGQIIYPAAYPNAYLQSTRSSFFGMDTSTLLPIAGAAAGLMALAYIAK
jgi:hypothetical protein